MDNTINASVGLAGRFCLTFTNTKTGEVREYEFNNLILNSGLDRYGAMTGNWDHIEGCILGTSTDEPVVTQTTMSGILGSSTTVQASNDSFASNTTTLPYWTKAYRTFRFNTGVATGNISQIAIGWGISTSANTYQGLFSLARVRDSGGNPITITKLADEVLDVRYELQIIAPQYDSTGTVNIGGVAYNYIARPHYVQAWRANYPIRAGNYSTAGMVYDVGLVAQNTYISGTYSTCEGTFINPSPAGTFVSTATIYAGLNSGNISGGFRTATLDFYGHKWQIQYSNASNGSRVPKDATKTMRLNFAISFGRATPI